MKIVVLSPPQHKYEKEAEIITQLFKTGLSTYHLRKPLFSFDTMVRFLKKIPSDYHNRIKLHSHHSLIRKFPLEGLHYTAIHLEPTLSNWWKNKRLAHYL